MAERESMGRNIEQSFVQRVVQGVRYMVSGVGPENFFGPQQPLVPQAQEQVEGRTFDYPVGVNLNITPRGTEGISFWQLRGLADSYDLLRSVIETRKDQVESFQWEITPSDQKANSDEFKDEIAAVTELMRRPDRQHMWSQWLRMIVEEILVTDALAIYPRRNRGGGIYGFEQIDGATLKIVIDDYGRTPEPPSPAYQQIIKGIPAADYSSDQLVYMVRNPRIWKLYGMSPVEQIIMTVNIALRRQLSQLEFYTAGNIPEAIAQVPENWSPKQIADFQIWWDSLNQGNSAQRRKMTFIPSLENIVFPKDAVLKDEFDEWLSRLICFAFSISPSALVKQVNRASGEQMADTAKEEGLLPLLRFIESMITYLIQYHMQLPQLMFKFKIVNEIDPKAQAEIHGAYIDRKVLTPDEVREDLGKDALTPEQRETAWPTPTAPEAGLDEELPGDRVDVDGKPLVGAAKDAVAAKEPSADTDASAETPAEKMLAAALKMLDPAALAKIISEAAKSQAPRIVEVRPEVNVEVGDTNVYAPGAGS